MSWFEVLNSLAGILGVVLTFVFYFKGKRDKKPKWSIGSVNLIEDYLGTVEGLDIRYQGEKIRNLSISKLAFWNDGAQTIHQTDLSDADPLRLEANGNGRILSAKVVGSNNIASRPSVTTQKDNRVLLSFDYLDRGQGFVVQVFHEGISPYDLGVKGVIKGGGLDIAGYNLDSGRINLATTPGERIILIIGCSALSVFVMSKFITWMNSGISGNLLEIGVVVMIGFLCMVIFLELRSSRSGVPPSGLEIFVTNSFPHKITIR